MTLEVEISEGNRRKLEELATRTGKSRSQLLNEAIEQFPALNEVNVSPDWRTAWRQVAGVWRDRDDLPDFDEVRRSFDRDLGQDERQ